MFDVMSERERGTEGWNKGRQRGRVMSTEIQTEGNKERNSVDKMNY
jgi:hypothetical protein